MEQTLQTIQATLDSIDLQATPVGDRDVAARLDNTVEARGDKAGLTASSMADLMAFAFCEDYRDDKSGWGLYYGPMWVMQNEAGQWTESPSIKHVDEKVLAHWSARAQNTTHPVLRFRYADLWWEFSKRVAGTSVNVSMPRIVIDAAIEIATRQLCDHSVKINVKLRRAMSIALSIGDDSRLSRLREAVLSFERAVAVDSQLGLWGIAFDLLVENTRANASAEQVATIIKDLESRLARVSGANGAAPDPFATEAAAMRLVSYYRRENDVDAMRRVLRTFGSTFLKAAESAAPIVASSWLHRVFSLYNQHGLREDADAVAVLLRSVGAKVKDPMSMISHETEIPKEKIEAYLRAMTAGGLATALTRIAFQFVLDKDQMEAEVQEQAKSTALMHIMPRTIYDDDGRMVAHIGTYDADPEGHVVQHTSQRMAIDSFFLRRVFERVLDQYKPGLADLTACVFVSPAFAEPQRPIVELGIKAYLENRWVESTHLLVPQVEDALRTVVEQSGDSSYKQGRNGSLMLKNFDDLLRMDCIEKAMGQNIVEYFRILFVDQRGWNVRNNVCHGISPASAFGAGLADRVLHAVLVLAQLRRAPTTDTETSPPAVADPHAP